MIDVRAPIVAGSFYDLDPNRLKKQIRACFDHELGPKGIKKEEVIAGVVPHAGYVYSGHVASWVYSRIEKANYIILGPNHSGIGANFAIAKKGLWKTPLGGAVIDEEMADKLMEECEILEHDVIPHESEHSIEVQLPFLQYRFGSDLKFVPICILNEFADETLLESCKVVGKGIAKAIEDSEENWIVLASSDFSHYVPQESAKKTDRYLINSIKKLDEEKFFKRINKRNATVCGYGGIATVIAAAKELGAEEGELLKYATSGDITGNFASVVGYASIIIY